MADPVIDDIVDRMLRLYPGRDHRVGMRSAFMDAACICTALAHRIEAANPGRGKGSVSQVGQAIACAVRKAGDEMMAVRDRIEIAERGPLPLSDCQDEHPRGAMQVCPVSDADCLPHCTRTGEADCPLTKRDFGLPRGGISHAPDSPLLRCQDDFGRRRERKVPRYRDPEEWR